MTRDALAKAIAVVLVASLLTACTAQHMVTFSPTQQVPAYDKGPLPLRVGLLMPDAASMPPTATLTRCAFGKTVVTVPYAEEYSRLAYQVAAQRFKKVDIVSDKLSAAGRYDALLEFAPAEITPDSSCIQFIAFWMIFPLFLPPDTWTYGVAVRARILDAAGRTTVAEASHSRFSFRDYGIQEALSGAVDDVLSDLTTSTKFIQSMQSAREERISASERQGDRVAQRGRAHAAVSEYLDAYHACPDDDPAKERLFKKLVDAARLGSIPVPADAQTHADRGQAFVKLAKDPAGFAKAAREFELAAAGAPWWAEAHFNAGLAHEKAGDPRAAAASLERFLLAAPDSPEAAAVKQKLVELEVTQELAPGAADEPASSARPLSPAPAPQPAPMKL